MPTKYEYQVIGAALNDPKTIPQMMEKLSRDDFSDEFGKMCFDLLAEIRGEEKPDMMMLARTLEERGSTDAVNALSEAVKIAFPSHAEAYCRFVREDACKRMLDEIMALKDTRPLLETASEIEKTLRNCKQEQDVFKHPETFIAWYNNFMNLARHPGEGVCRTGYPKLDKYLGGFAKSGLYIIGARPGMGKTTFALNIANRICRRDDAVLFVSLEMSLVQIMSRRIAIESGISYKGLQFGTITSEQYGTAMDAFNLVAEKPFYLMNSVEVSVAKIEATARQHPDIKCIIVDYLGLIAPAHPNKMLYEQVTETSRALKMMAINLNVPVVCLCQLNRQSTQTSDKRPGLADLRDSGAIEQDADAVLLLHRNDYYESAEAKEMAELEGAATGRLEVIIAKNRHGESNVTVGMTWYGASGEISEIEI